MAESCFSSEKSEMELTEWTTDTIWKVFEDYDEKMQYLEGVFQEDNAPIHKEFIKAKTFWSGLQTVQTWTLLRKLSAVIKKRLQNKQLTGEI